MKKLLVCLITAGLFGCSNGATTPASQETAQKEIPITTKSPEAMAAFSKGRDALDNLRLYVRARLDPRFTRQTT